MRTGIRHVAAAAVLCGSMSGCAPPHCPEGYNQIDGTCYRRKDAGAQDAGEDQHDASRGDAHEAGNDGKPEVEADAGAAQEAAEAGPDGTDDPVDESEDAAVTASDAATPCIPSAEVCDGKDNDCDERVDEDKQTWYCDDDGDGFAASTEGKTESCDKPAPSDACNDWTTTPPSGLAGQDCDDSTARRFPGAEFGLAVGASGDLNCNGQTETRLDFVASSVPGYYSSTTSFNICQHTGGEALEAGECDCWFSTSIGEGFVGFVNGSAVFDGPGTQGGPYFMRTFPCSKDTRDAIFLQRIVRLGGECMQEAGGGAAVRQLCR